MTGRITAAVLLLAATAVPAHAGENGLQKLYELAEQRSEAAAVRGHDSKAGARARFGSYEPPGVTVAPSPVHSVMHYHRTPDGRLVLECRIEHAAGMPDRDHGPVRPGPGEAR